jgi:hypothetical protein
MAVRPNNQKLKTGFILKQGFGREGGLIALMLR